MPCESRQMLCSSTEEVTPGSSSEAGPSSSTVTPHNLTDYRHVIRGQQDPPSSSVLLTSHGSDDVRNSLCPGSSTATDTGAQATVFTDTTPTGGDREMEAITYEIKC